MNEQKGSVESDVLTSLMKEVLGKPKTAIMEYLILNTEKSGKFIDIDKIWKATHINRVKAYKYLKELKGHKLVLSSGERPAKFRVIKRVMLAKSLGEIAEESSEHKKKEIDKQLVNLKERLSHIETLTPYPSRLELTTRLHAIRKDELDTFLCESLGIIGENDEVLCETPSASFLLITANEDSKDRFGSLLKNRLLDGSIRTLKCICNIEPGIAGHNEMEFSTVLNELEQCVKNIERFVALFTDRVYASSPTTVIFGDLRVVMSFAYALDTQPYAGFMLEGLDTVRSFKDRYKKTFDDLKKEAFGLYLDDLWINQKAGVLKSKTILESLAKSIDRNLTEKQWKQMSWNETKEMLLRNVSEEQLSTSIKSYSILQLEAARKTLFSC